MGQSSRQAASDISWDKMAEKAERDLEIRTRRRDSILVPIALFVSLSRRGLGTRKRRALPFLVPRPRRLRETKRAMGTRMKG